MNLKEWAEREVEIACKKENPDRKEGEWDYGCACYESALKAFNSLLEDGHSGFSINMTKHILMRLIDGKPLTPIEDTDDIWDERCCLKEGAVKSYQCKRMSSLFKDVYSDGSVKYTDVNSSYMVTLENPDVTWSNGFVRSIIDEMFPITMPYNPPTKAIKVICEESLTDRKNGDYDTLGVLYAVKPDGERIDIYRYFDGSGKGWREIDIDEYNERLELDKQRREREELEYELSQHN